MLGIQGNNTIRSGNHRVDWSEIFLKFAKIMYINQTGYERNLDIAYSLVIDFIYVLVFGT